MHGLFWGLPKNQWVIWEALKWILRCLNGSSMGGSIYTRAYQRKDMFKGFVNVNYEGNIYTMKYILDFVFTSFQITISMKTTQLPIMASSTTQADYTFIAEEGEGNNIVEME